MCSKRIHTIGRKENQPSRESATPLMLIMMPLTWRWSMVTWIGREISCRILKPPYVAKNPENNHYYFVGGDGISLLINSTLKPFDDPNIRKAISMGIDRAMIVKTAMFDYIPVADATGLGDTYKVWKDQAAIDAGTWMAYDPAKANEMLDAAGYTRRGRRHSRRQRW